MARLTKPPRYQRHKKNRMSTSQIDILRSLVRGSHVPRATHAAAIPTTPATTTDIEPTVNQVSDLAEEERDEGSSGAKGSEKKALGPTGESEWDMKAESTHPSIEERAKTPTHGASRTGEQSAVQQSFTNGSEMFGRLVTLYALLVGLMTLIDVVRVWYTGAFASYPASVPTNLWSRIIVRFGIGFVVVKYRKLVERYTNHIRLALVAFCLCGLVREGLRLEMLFGSVSLRELCGRG